jgi:serine protease AprX
MKKYYLLFVFFCLLLSTDAQNYNTSGSIYSVEFKDKKNSPYSIEDPLAFLSHRAIERRELHKMPVNKQDLPVNPFYLDSLRSAGAKVLFALRWFNTAVIMIDTGLVLKNIEKLDCVRNIKRIYKYTTSEKSNNCSMLYQNYGNDNDTHYGESYRQIAMMNGQLLHQRAYMGQGIIIAVIDGGFYKVNTMQSFSHLIKNNKILATWDFVDGEENVYDNGTHGMSVLGTMAGFLPGKLIGTAPKAEYLLLRSENTINEYPVEEYAWVAAAEFADSFGANIINSSLGYSVYDDSTMSINYDQLDGKTVLISRAVNMASSRGILVVTSAGNEGDKKWKHITAPADADSAISVGAVDMNGNYAYFSSIGPTSDGRIKPNVAAMGLLTVTSSNTGDDISYASGTSLSSPVICGMTASLMSAFPAEKIMNIKQAIEKSAHSYTAPNNYSGYGIPDYNLAYEILDLMHKKDTAEFRIIELFPNPFDKELFFSVYTANETRFSVQISNKKGEIVFEDALHVRSREFERFRLVLPNKLKAGMYIFNLISPNKSEKRKIIKL